ncbi:serine protease [Aquincola sp. MAHUQ-54]|uniref:Serine protease n=1 Tax=Aquincola agrisoli TaxID=3119538 RepID=A0AAW9QCD8_9BURK
MESFKRRRCLQVLGAAGWIAAGGGVPALAGPVETIAQARPSVVAVGSYRPTDNPRFGFRGSGFVVDDGRHVVTNAHVLPEIPAEAVGAYVAVLVRRHRSDSPELRRATVVTTLRDRDLALLRIDGEPLPSLALAQPEQIAEGQPIVLMGFPLGGALGFTTVSHRGMVSSITPIAVPVANSRQLNEQAIARLRRGSFDIYQLDATAYPGNSGGPVLDADTGRVIGVVNMVFIKGSKETALTDPSGITYALPVQLVKDLLAAPR